MPDGQVLEFDRVTKSFGDTTAVADFSGRVEPGVVTGFLGPNGAGKTTTLRMLLGILRPTSGTATIGGKAYGELTHPARIIGAMPEDPAFRPRRTVQRHLEIAAKANSIPAARVDEVIRFVGLDNDAEVRVAALSLGMRQRLSAATALLGDPGALVLDEPANGLDPEGIRWMRMLIRGLADEGRTVLVSSHVLSEVEQIADDILVIARGTRKYAGSLAALAGPERGPVIVDAVDRAGLTDALSAAGFEFEVLRSGLTVRGSHAAAIGAVAASAGIALTVLQQRGPSLEDVFLDLVHDRPIVLRTPETDAAAQAAPAEDAPVAETPEAPADETPEGDAPADGAEPDTAASEGEPTADDDAPADATVALPLTGDENTPPADAEDAPVEEASVEDERPLPGAADLAAVAAGLTPDAARSPLAALLGDTAATGPLTRAELRHAGEGEAEEAPAEATETGAADDAAEGSAVPPAVPNTLDAPTELIPTADAEASERDDEPVVAAPETIPNVALSAPLGVPSDVAVAAPATEVASDAADPEATDAAPTHDTGVAENSVPEASGPSVEDDVRTRVLSLDEVVTIDDGSNPDTAAVSAAFLDSFAGDDAAEDDDSADESAERD